MSNSRQIVQQNIQQAFTKWTTIIQHKRGCTIMSTLTDSTGEKVVSIDIPQSKTYHKDIHNNVQLLINLNDIRNIKYHYDYEKNRNIIDYIN